jgi:carboxyvinyl-carboxyphosphonate phosphorylmutase
VSSSVRRSNLRAILSSDRCALAATIFDPFSARIAEALKFEAGLMGGSLASYAVLGAPDLILITLTELAEQVYRCTRVSSVPLVVDCDHGYGNALNVMRTIQEIDHAGAAGVMIEDTLLPRAFGASDAPQILSIDEGVGKIRAAVKARGDSDLVVLGRTSAHAITNIDDAIARCVAFEAAGVDGLMLPGLRTREELDRISAAVRLPIMSGSPAEALCDEGYLASRRVRLWSSGHQTLNVAMNALYEAMKKVREGTLSSDLPGAASKQLVDTVTAAADYAAWTKAYLR